MYRQLQASASDRARLDTAPQILTNPFIQQQKGELASLQQQAEQASGKLGEKHPDMIKLASAIRLAQSKLDTEIREDRAVGAQRVSGGAGAREQPGGARSTSRSAKRWR